MQRVTKSDYVDILNRVTLQKEFSPSVTEETEEKEEKKETEEPERKTKITREGANTHISLFVRPPEDFLRDALESNGEAQLRLEDGWHSLAWVFARLCKSHPDLGNLDALNAWATVRDQLRKLEREEGLDVWSYFNANEDEVGLDFVYAWDRIRSRAGKSLITDAASRAYKIALKPPVPRGPTYAKFISICGHLQAIRKDQIILVPVALFGDIIGCSKMSVSRMIQFAIEDGLLQVVEDHNYARHKARRYRFALEKYPTL